MKTTKINTNINMFKIKSVREAKYVRSVAVSELNSDDTAIKSAKEDVKVARASLKQAKAELKARKAERSELRKFIKRIDARIKALPAEMATNRDINAVFMDARKAGLLND